MAIHPTFVLVHGSWHDGDCWSPVRAHLTAAGFRSSAPTLPGHAAGDDRASVTHDDYVAAVDAAVDAVDGPVALVGHSFGGSVISRVAELRPERCAGLVYYSAFVPRDGDRVADSLPAAMVEFLEAAAAASADRSVALPTTARDAIPTTYIACRDDRALPAGSFHPGQSGRLRSAALIEIDGDHEALLTAAQRLAWALLQSLPPDRVVSDAGAGARYAGMPTGGSR
jgi:pimeloyl-ACP methyl ester carboxylesterase